MLAVSLRIQEGVKMVMARVHAGGTDRCCFLVGQVGGGEAAALGLKALERLILVGGDEVAGDAAMAGDGHRLPLCHHAVMAEITGEFGRRDRRCHGLGLSVFA